MILTIQMNGPSREEKNLRYNHWIKWAAYRRSPSRLNSDLIHKNDSIPLEVQRHMKIPSSKRPRPLDYLPTGDGVCVRDPSVNNWACFVLQLSCSATEKREDALESNCSDLPMIPLKRQKTTGRAGQATMDETCPSLVEIAQTSSLQDTRADSLGGNQSQE